VLHEESAQEESAESKRVVIQRASLIFVLILAGLSAALMSIVPLGTRPLSFGRPFLFSDHPWLTLAFASVGHWMPTRALQTTDASRPLGLPEVPVPAANPLTPEKIRLGRQLFFEKRLSEDGTISCAVCHDPQKGFGDGKTISVGICGSKGRRHSPSLFNVAFQSYFFWDGRTTSLEAQTIEPLRNPAEMGDSVEKAVARLSRLPEYQRQFRDIFGGPPTSESLAQALASFERTILSGDSPYDRYEAGEQTALSATAVEGMELFTGKAHCNLCHQGFNLSDGLFHNLGVGWSSNSFQDLGRSDVTGVFKDQGAFKTPTLREISESAPYMHDGSLASLEEVIEFYDQGGNPNPHLDRLIQPLHLRRKEKSALLEFLKSLNGSH